MDIALTIAAFLVLSAGGTYMIHRLNSAHGERIALHSYGRSRSGRPAADRAAGSTAPPHRTPPRPPRTIVATIETAAEDASDRTATGTGPRTTSRTPQGVEAQMPHRTEVTSMHASPRRSHGTGSTHSTGEDPPAHETADGDPPVGGLAEVRIIAASPDIAQRVAQLLRRNFRCDEPRSYPAGPDGRDTLLHLTVDTGHVAAEPSAKSPWLTTSHTQARRAHSDEPG